MEQPANRCQSTKILPLGGEHEAQPRAQKSALAFPEHLVDIHPDIASPRIFQRFFPCQGDIAAVEEGESKLF